MFELKNKFINFVNQKILIEYSFILIITTYLTTIKFEDFFNSKGQLVIGNYGDPRYILFMVEHFYQSLNINFLNIINPPNLFPYKWTISLSDWLLFPGFFHAFFRTLGLDLFNSFEYSLILCNSLFFIFLYFAIRKISGINRIFSLYISLLISYGRFLFDYRYWLQNFVVFFVPLLFLFLFEGINNQNLEKSNYLRFLNRNLISGFIVMFTLFSNFYLGASLLMITFLNFVIDRILSFKKNKPFQNYVFKNIFSRDFLYLFSPSLLFIIFNIPGYLIADISDISSDFQRLNIKDIYFDPLAITVFIAWLDIFSKKFFLKRNFKFLSLHFKLLCIITVPFLIYINLIPDIFGLDFGNRFLSINQLYAHFFGTLFRDHDRFFFPFYLLSILVACSQIRITTNDLSLSLKKFNFRFSNKLIPLSMLIVFLFIYKLENKYIFFKYTHDIDVPMHKAMLSDAKSQLLEKNNCESFYLESYDNNHQINQLSALLIAINSNVPTLHGYTGAYPKDWPLKNSTGFYNKDFIKKVNSLINQKNINPKTVCKIEYRKPPFKDLSFNSKTADYIYGANGIENIKMSNIEDEGIFSLLKDEYGGYWIKESDNSKKILIRDDNGVVGIGTKSPYTIIAAERINGINKLFNYNHANANAEIWELDQNWKFIKNIQNIQPQDQKLLNLANKDFEADFSFDNKLIDQSGNYFLVKDKFGTYFVKDKNQENNYIPILRDNKIVGFSNDLPSFTLIGVEEINGEKLLIDYTPYNYTAYIWKVDSGFNFIKDLKIIRGEGKEFFDLENDFKLDINNDGLIGDKMK